MINRTYRRIRGPEKRLIARQYTQGVPVRKIAQALSCSQGTVYSALADEGVSRRSRGPRMGSGMPEGPVYDNPPLVARIGVAKKLRDDGYTVTEIMFLMRRGRTTIYSYLNRPDQECDRCWVDAVYSDLDWSKVERGEVCL